MGNEAPEWKSGRPQKLTSRDKQAIAHLMANEGDKMAVELTRFINNEREDKVSADTNRCALKDERLGAVKRKNKKSLKNSPLSTIKLGVRTPNLDS